MILTIFLILLRHSCSITVLEQINIYRSRHQVGPVEYSKVVNTSAQEWANKHIFGHSATGYGENIALVPADALEQAIDMWYDESKKYNYVTARYSPETGHFTQLVWKNAKFIGLGYSNIDNNILVVMQFDPPGNMLGQFASNVFPPAGSMMSPQIPTRSPSLPHPKPSISPPQPPLSSPPPPPPAPPTLTIPPPDTKGSHSQPSPFDIFSIRFNIKALYWTCDITHYQFGITFNKTK